jgi:hypothetical protein
VSGVALPALVVLAGIAILVFALLRLGVLKQGAGVAGDAGSAGGEG